MTHMLHRQGSVESLKRDYALIVYTSRMNRTWAKAKLSEVAGIMLDSHIVNTGLNGARTNMSMGFDREQFIETAARENSVACCVSGKEDLKGVIEKLMEADLGISVTVSGLIEDVIPLVQEMGLKPHTINLSLGIIGNTDRLPEPEVLELTTMCGHALIAGNLFRKLKQEVAAGARTARDAAMMLGRPCVCGVYNPARGAELLTQP